MFWDAVLAWFGWNIAAPILFLLAAVIFLMIWGLVFEYGINKRSRKN